MLEISKIQVLAFDCCNTVFSIDGVPRAELSDYIAQVRRPEWAPLTLPASWLDLPAHKDSAQGIARLQTNFVCVTCSNWHADMLGILSGTAGIAWDAIIPFERMKVYKPHNTAYVNVARVTNVCVDEVLMVTANEAAPDIEKARELGMQAILIDRRDKYGGKYPRTIIELAEVLGC